MNINSLQNIILSAPYFSYLSQSALLFENIAEIPPQISSILLQNIAFDKPFPEIKVKDRNPCLYFNSTGQQYFLNNYSVLFMPKSNIYVMLVIIRLIVCYFFQLRNIPFYY